MKMKNPFKIPMYIFGTLASLVFMYILYLTVFSQDAANARHGVPETGWAGVIAVFFFGPIFILFSAITFAFWIAARHRSKKNLDEAATAFDAQQSTASGTVPPPLAATDTAVDPPVPDSSPTNDRTPPTNAGQVS